MANRGWYFGKPYEANIAEVDHRWHLLTISWKWLDEKQIHVAKLPDYKLYKKEPHNDIELSKLGWALMDEADIIVAHNGNSFDQKVMTTTFMRHRLGPVSAYQQVDTKLVAKKYARFDSNKLDHLGDEFGIGRKKHHIGFPLWLGCDEGDMKMWKTMCDYNIQDVRLLEKLYLELRPYDRAHPNVANLKGQPDVCRTCGLNKGFVLNGYDYTKTGKFQRFRCKNCLSNNRSRAPEKTDKPEMI